MILRTTLCLLALGSLLHDASGQACNTPDAFEPNDDCLAPALLTPGFQSGLTLLADGEDYYRITIPPGAMLTADLDTILGPDPFLTVFDLGCNNVIASFGSDFNESIVVAQNLLTVSTDVILWVASNSLTGCTEYTLDTLISASNDPCVGVPGDVFEDADECTAALPLPNGFYGGLRSELQDEDWYRLTIPPESRLIVTGDYSVTTSATLAWLYEDECAILDAVGPFDALPVAQILDVGTAMDLPSIGRRLETDNLTNQPKDVLLLIVADPQQPSVCMDYSLDVQTMPLPCAGSFDALDSASTIFEGPGLLPGEYSDLVVSQADPDTYGVWLGAGQTLTVNASFTHNDGNIDLFLAPCFTGACGSLADSMSQTDDESVSITVGLDRFIAIQVIVGQLTSQPCNTYDLEVQISGPEPSSYVPFCFGDGSGLDCPCLNNSDGGGCRNSTGKGAILNHNAGAFFDPAFDQLGLTMVLGPPQSFAILVSADNALPQANPGLGILAFDGLRCIGGNLRRLGIRATDVNGETLDPWGWPGAPVGGGLFAQGGFVLGQTALFQVFYRDSMNAACATGQNSTNALRVVATP